MSIHPRGLWAGLILLALAAGAAPAHAADEPGVTRIGDWKLNCPNPLPAGTPRCFLTQSVVANDTGLGVLAVAIYFWPNNPVPQIAFNLAPQADNSQDLTLEIDREAHYNLTLGACDDKSCSTSGNLRPELLKKLKDGKSAVVTFAIQKQPQRIGVPLSLKGFVNAFKTLEAKGR